MDVSCVGGWTLPELSPQAFRNVRRHVTALAPIKISSSRELSMARILPEPPGNFRAGGGYVRGGLAPIKISSGDGGREGAQDGSNPSRTAWKLRSRGGWGPPAGRINRRGRP